MSPLPAQALWVESRVPGVHYAWDNETATEHIHSCVLTEHDQVNGIRRHICRHCAEADIASLGQHIATVGELRASLADLPDAMPIVLIEDGSDTEITAVQQFDGRAVIW